MRRPPRATVESERIERRIEFPTYEAQWALTERADAPSSPNRGFGAAEMDEEVGSLAVRARMRRPRFSVRPI